MAAASDVTIKIHADARDFTRAVRKAQRDVWWLLHPRVVLALWTVALLTIGFACGLLV